MKMLFFQLPWKTPVMYRTFSPTKHTSAPRSCFSIIIAGAGEAIAAHAVEVDAALPVGCSGAVDPSRLELVRLAEEAEVHALAELGQSVAPCCA